MIHGRRFSRAASNIKGGGARRNCHSLAGWGVASCSEFKVRLLSQESSFERNNPVATQRIVIPAKAGIQYAAVTVSSTAASGRWIVRLRERWRLNTHRITPESI